MTWSESESNIYRQLAAIAVPRRAEQIAALLTLIPFAVDAPFRAVELASGQGYLTHAILNAFPAATVLALDVEGSMRVETQQRSAAYAERLQVAPFDMAQVDWYERVDDADVVVSSLCVHHLDGAQKQAMFRALTGRMSGRGALLIADLVLPKRAQSRELFAATWDQSVRAAAGDDATFQHFLTTQWNIFRYPDDFDKPSPLFDQLAWLSEAGLHDVDCFWHDAGHAIYGGYGAAAGQQGIAYKAALRVAQDVLRA